MTSEPDFGSRREFYTFAPDSLAQELPDFEILREVGKGSMGIVYEARRRSDGQRVALKVLPPSLTLTERALARFLREGRIIAGIEHPAIVRVYDQGRQGRLHYFVMEFVDGVTIEQRLRVGPMPVRQACAICARVGRALQFAHDHGVVHRDIKPGNIMLRQDRGGGDGTEVAITDFGLARETGTGSMTESGALVGTPMYMAPEMVLEGSAQAGTLGDVYGLGATLYTMVTGQPPFEGPTAQSVLKAVLDRDPTPPRRLRHDLPAPVEAIIAKSMERDPHRRYGSAGELADDLERFLAGERVQARRAGPLGRLWRKLRRRPLAAALVGLLLLVVVFGLALLREGRLRALQADLAAAERSLALADTRLDERQQPRTAADRRDLLLRAVAQASDVIRRDSGYALAWFVRAKARHRLHDYADAVRDLDMAESLLGEPRSEILYFRIDALRMIGTGEALRRMQEDLKRLLEIDPGPHTRTLVAEHLLDLGAGGGLGPEEREELLALVADVLRPVPGEDPRAGVARARLLELQGDPEAALAAMRRQLQAHQGSLAVHSAAAAMFARLGLPSELAAEQEMLRLLEPESTAQPPVPLDLQGVDGFLRDVHRLLQTAEPDAGKKRRGQ